LIEEDPNQASEVQASKAIIQVRGITIKNMSGVIIKTIDQEEPTIGNLMIQNQ
jgi:hypothetical protein